MLRFILLSVLLAVSYGQTNNAGTLSNDARLAKFTQLLDRAGISPSAGGTIFAPTTEALQAFGLWNKYTSQAEFYVHLRDLLLWHFVTEGRFTFDQIFDGGRQFLENHKGNITISQQYKKIGNVPAAAFIEANISTSDGIVHVIDDVIIPPYLAMNIIEQLLDDSTGKFAFSTMANLAMYVGLDEQINKMYEHGITLLVPPNRRFNRAQIDVSSLLTEEMRNYTRDFVKCHMIVDNYYEAGVFAHNSEMDQEQILVASELGTSMWITTTDGSLRFQSTAILLADQAAKNGIYHVMDLPLYPPFASDFAEFTQVSTNWDTGDCFRFFRQSQLSSEDISIMFNTTLTLFCPTREGFAFFNNEDFNRLLEPVWVRHATEFLFNHISAGARTREELVNEALGTITMLNGATYELRKSGSQPRIKNGSEQARSEFGDMIALDGYLHILDQPITPTAVSRSIYDQANENPDFSLLIENIDFVDLTDLVDRDSPLTMLAPDNRSFRRQRFGTLEAGEIIKRHIFPGLLFWDEFANRTQATTVNGITHGVELRGELNEFLYVGNAFVYESDILARNGVMHYIDRVIGLDYETVPPTTSPAPTITARPTVYLPPTAAPVEQPTTGPFPHVMQPIRKPTLDSSVADDKPAEPVSSAASKSVLVVVVVSTLSLLMLAES